MTWQEALVISQKSWKEESPIATSNSLVDFPTWKGLELLINIPERLFSKYLSRIDSGEIVVGPSAHTSYGKICRNLNHWIGLYRTKRQDD